MAALVWIQRELRIDYLPALQTALQEHNEVVVAYFHDHKQNLGGASQLWLYQSLKSLQQDYVSRKGLLSIVSGDFSKRFTAVLLEQNISHVYYTYQVGETFFKQQEQALAICEQHKVFLQPFFSEDFFVPAEVKNLKGSPYLVFTPFYKNCLKQIDRVAPLDLTAQDLSATAKIKVPAEYQTIPQQLEKVAASHWAKKMQAYWQMGEQQAWQRFDDFLQQQLADYGKARDFPAIEASSQMSPYLHFGQVSPVSLYFYVQSKIEQGEISYAAAEPWIRQLFWRNFARYLLVWFPDKEKMEFNEKYAALDWHNNHQALEAWQTGHTGIPIVDAGMRELWETGTMHNRVRMLVASLLTKNLNVDWRHGLQWFADTLFDADPANNSMGWQWVAGCGVDAAPYYRLFNPVVQSEKFDKSGEYIKKWLPELRALSSKAIHEPWNHKMECQMKKIQLGVDYPYPIVDLKATREAHLQRVEALKSKAS